MIQQLNYGWIVFLREARNNRRDIDAQKIDPVDDIDEDEIIDYTPDQVTLTYEFEQAGKLFRYIQLQDRREFIQQIFDEEG